LRAKNSADNPNEFYDNQIKSFPNKIAKSIQDDFESFCKHMGLSLLNDNSADPINRARDYLSRMDFPIFQDNEQSQTDIIERISDNYITNAPEEIYDIFTGYATNNDRLGVEITISEINNHLSSRGIFRVDFGSTTKIHPRIQTLNDEFESTFNPLDNKLICREEVNEIYEMIKQGKSVVVHGKSGAGKSGCIQGLIQKLKSEVIPYLAIKLDRRTPETSAFKFGEHILDLPSSPLTCLSSVSNKTNGVLILDQLDALRWTSHRTGTALAVCMEMINQAKRLNSENSNGKLSIIFVCRTIDMETDGGIKSLFKPPKDSEEEMWHKAEIGDLHDDVVRDFVGKGYDTLSEKSKKLLRNINHLTIWSRLSNERKQIEYSSTYRLIQEYWKQITEEALNREISDTEINQLKMVLVEKMTQASKQEVRKSALANCSQKVIGFSASKGIIIGDEKISFAHQSFYDVFSVESMINQLDDRVSIVKLLGTPDKQTPALRYRLQMLLQFLAEDDPSTLLDCGRALLDDENIRYYMKYVFWEVVGQLTCAENDLLQFINDCINTEWFNAIFSNVIYGHPYYVNHFISNGLILCWLNDSEHQNHAIRVLGSVNTVYGDVVADTLIPFALIDNTTDNDIYRLALCWDIADDSEKMFSLRLSLLKNNTDLRRDYINADKLLKKNPERVIELLYALASVDEESESDFLESSASSWRKSLKTIGTQMPVFVCDKFMPLIESKTLDSEHVWDRNLHAWSNVGVDAKLGRQIVCMTIEAGKFLAGDDPNKFESYFNKYLNSSSLVIREILLYTMISLPSDYSDLILEWLIKDNCRNMFDETGDLHKKLEAARLLIEMFSPYCSYPVFIKLEQAITHFHSIHEKFHAEYRYNYRKTAEPGSGEVNWAYWGKLQAYILPSLDKTRISEETRQLIGVLDRRFAGLENILGGTKSRIYMSNGPGPSIKRDVSDNFTDKQWIRLISCKKLNKPSFPARNYRNMGDTESTPSSFSQSYESIGRWNPERFVALSTRFPPNADKYYIQAVWRLASLTEAPNKDVQSNWKPASFESVQNSVEQFISHSEVQELNMCFSLCRLVRDRANDNWSQAVINHVSSIALDYDENDDKWDGKDVENTSLNRVRSSAAHTISQLLWENYDRYSALHPTIEKLVADNNPIVRYAILEAAIASCNIDKPQGIEWVLTLLGSDERIARSRRGLYMLYWLWAKKYNECEVIIQTLITSDDEKSQERGAWIATEIAIRQDGKSKFFAEFIRSGKLSDAHVKGCGEIIVELMRMPEYRERAKVMAHELLSYPVQVKKIFCRLFYRECLVLPQDIEFAKNIIALDPGEIYSSLKHFMDETDIAILDFTEIVLCLCDAYADIAKDATQQRGKYYSIISDLPVLVIGLYEKTNNEVVKKRCLDLWDAFYQSDVSNTRDITMKITNSF
jgi:hypothetical protein